MKFTTIKITPAGDKWKVDTIRDNVDRVNKETFPNAQGFFHCPDNISLEDGFETLKAKMIEAHKDEISKLIKSMNKLRKLKFEI